MYTSYKVLSFFLFASLFTQAQYNYSSNTAHVSIKEAIALNNDIIRERTANFEKKAESKPLMFVSVKRKISELNRVSNNLVKYINSIQKEEVSERILYELVDEDFYVNKLFTDSNRLSVKGEKLKTKIDSLYLIAKRINIHKLSHLDNFVDAHFNTNEEYYDAYEKKINFFEHHFFDTSNYGIMMSMNYLMLDVKVFQLLI